jgi:hypothetical protein
MLSERDKIQTEIVELSQGVGRKSELAKNRDSPQNAQNRDSE